MSTLWFLSGTACVVTDADDTLRYQGELTSILPGLVGTCFADGVDAALQTEEGRIYLFRADQYGRYDLARNALDDGYPLSIADQWPGTGDTPAASGVTAAGTLPAFQAVLCCGADVVQYDLAGDRVSGVSTVDQVFAGIPEGTLIDACVTTDSAMYLFSGDQYYRVDPATCIVEPDYPRPIEGNWPALTGFTPTSGFTVTNDVTADGLVLSPMPAGVDDPYASTPARALTNDQARQVLQALHDRGDLQLAANASPAWVSLAAARICGVEFRYWNGSVTQASALRNLDPRNAVAMARFAAWAASTYGVHTIAHIGVNGDDTGARTDCHGQGRAVDFAGVAGTRDGQEFDLSVLRDWGTKSVPNEQDPAGPRPAKWPAGNRQLTYRLASDPDASPLATEFFAAAYQFIASQWQDGDDLPTGAAAISEIGHRSFVMNPDHPASDAAGKSGREAHANHLHMQIGKTGRQ